jgi:hypothetical protein
MTGPNSGWLSPWAKPWAKATPLTINMIDKAMEVRIKLIGPDMEFTLAGQLSFGPVALNQTNYFSSRTRLEASGTGRGLYSRHNLPVLHE